MSRREFPKSVRLAAWERSGGRCECGCRLLIRGTPHYDHVVPDALGGTNDLENCQVLDPKCHRRKTVGRDVPMITKAVRTRERRLGLRDRRRGFKGSRTFSGEIRWK